MVELHEKRKAEEKERAKKFQEEFERKHAEVLKASAIENSGMLQPSVSQQPQQQPTTTTPSSNVFYNMFNGEILQPQPLEPKSQSTAKAAAPASKNGELNTREFENNDTNPFDNVELQSIDELKELNQLFQTLNQPPQETNNKAEESHTEGVSSTQPMASVPAPVSAYSAPVQPYGQSSVSYPGYGANQSYAYHHQQQPGQPYQQQQPAVVVPSNVYRAPVPTAYCPPSVGYGPVSVSLPTTTTYPQPAYTHSAAYVPSSSVPYHVPPYQPLAMHGSLSQPQLETRMRGADISREYTPTVPTEPVVLRSSKSVSDLTKVESSHPANSHNNNNPVNGGLHGSNGQLTGHPTITTNISLPDPYDTLSPEERRFVDNLQQMGFQRDRVSRAVKHIGSQNDRKLFEYLLTLQQLEDEGFHCYESEIALHMNNYNKPKVRRSLLLDTTSHHILTLSTQAKHFLTSLRHICDLGFDKDAAIKALFKANNDQNKALEVLYAQRAR